MQKTIELRVTIEIKAEDENQMWTILDKVIEEMDTDVENADVKDIEAIG